MGKTKIVLDLQSDLILNNALIVRPSGIVKSDLPGLVDDINGLTMSITNEASARAAGDQQLSNNLSDLQTYVDTTVDSAITTLTSDLADETAARIAADAGLDGRINDIISNTNAPIIDSFAEVVAQMESMPGVDDSSIVVSENNISLKETVAAPASGIRTFGGLVNVGSEPSLDENFVDLSLVTKGYVTGLVDAETAARIADVDAEEVRAYDAEGVLQSNIDTEKGRIDAILLASDADKDSFAEIVSLINSVDTTNDQVFAGYVLSNDAALAAEISRAQDIESSIIATFSSALSAEEAARIADVDAEEARALAAEAALSSDLADLQSYVDTTVDSAISTLTSDLADETSARIADVDAEEARALAAEGVLQTNINTEEAARIAADSTLQGNIDSETSRAQIAETAISADLVTETNRATTAETLLQSNIDVEKGRIDAILLASDADKDNFAEIVTLINSVDTENDQVFAGYVLSNDAALSSLSATFSAALSTEEAARIADVDAEEARALAAEALLQAAIDAEATARLAADAGLDGRINDIISNTNAPIIDSFTEVVAQMEAMPGVDESSIVVDSENNISLKDTVAAPASGIRTFNGLVNVGSEPSLASNFVELSLVTKGYVTGLVDAEEAARIADVDAEEARALAAEAALSATFSAALAAETFRAQAAEIQLSNDLSDETSYRLAADTVLQSNIDVEKGRIDAILLASDADKDNFAEIVTLINSVDTENDQVFASYVLSNNAALSSLSSTFSAALSAEESARIADVDAEETRATAAEEALDAAKLDLAGGTMSGDINMANRSIYEASSITTSSTNTGDLNGLGSNDVYLGANLDAGNAKTIINLPAPTNGGDAANKTYVDSADATLQSNIDTEKARIDAILGGSTVDLDQFAEVVSFVQSIDLTNDDALLNAVIGIEESISDEVAERQAADSAIENSISSLESNINSELSTLSNSLNTEISDRISAIETVEANIVELTETLDTAILTINDSIDGVILDLDAEVVRATAAEVTLQSNIDVEKGRIDAILQGSDVDLDQFKEVVDFINSIDLENDDALMSVVINIENSISQEVTDRESADLVLEDTISSLDQTLSSNISILTDSLNTEISDRISAIEIVENEISDLSDSLDSSVMIINDSINGVILDLDTEVTRATTAEGVLQTNIDTEKARIDAILQGSDVNLDQFMEVVDFVNSIDLENDDALMNAIIGIENSIDDEIADREAADLAIQDTISSLESTLSSNISTLTSSLDQEIADRISAIESIEDEISDLTDSLDSSVLTINDSIDGVILDLDAEVVRATAAEGVLQTNIDTEKARIDAILQGSDVDLDQFKEVVDFVNSIDLENDDALMSAIINIENSISQEISNRESADSAIESTISSLEGTLFSEISLLTSSLDTEVSDRISAIETVESAIDDLTETVDSAVLTINNSIDDIISDLDTEVTRATTAEGVLQTNIDTEKARIDAILQGSDVNLDQFVEIVDFVQSIDLTNDDALLNAVIGIENSISDEASARQATDSAIEDTISSLESNMNSELSTLSNSLNTEIDNRISDISSVESAIADLSETVDTAVIEINDSIDAEVVRATAAEAALDAAKLNLAGGTMSGNISMNGQSITNLSVPTNGGDATRKSYVDEQDALKLSLTGGIMSGSVDMWQNSISNLFLENVRGIDMNGNSITNVLEPTLPFDATNKGYVDAGDAQLQSNINTQAGRIDAILDGSDVDLDQFAEVVSFVQSIDMANDDAILTAVTNINSAIDSEVDARIADVDAEEARATAAEAALQDAIDSEVAARIADVDAEEARAIAAEAVLDAAKLNLAGGTMTGSITMGGNKIYDVNHIYTGSVTTDRFYSNNSNGILVNTNLSLDGNSIKNLAEPIANNDAARKGYVDAGDARLSSDLADETAARIADVDAEETRALAAEAALSTDISTLQTYVDTTVDSAIATLTSDLADEIAARIADVDAEEVRAYDAEGVLQSNIDVEKGRIDAILLASDADKDSFAEIVSLINSVDTTNDQAFAGYVLSNDAALAAEVSRAQDIESSIIATFSVAISTETAARIADVDAEETRALAAEAALSSDLADLQSYVDTTVDSAISTLTSDLADETSARIADVDAEETRATAAEAALSATFSTALSVETFRATAAEIQLSNDLSDETSYRLDADTLLQSNIDVEKGRIDAILLASDADKDNFAEIVTLINSVDTENDQAFASYVLSNNAALSSLSSTFSAALSAEESARIADVDAEEARALAAELVLTNDLATETARATNQENILSAALTTEIARAYDAEGVLQSNINAEVTRATTAEALLQTNINTEANERMAEDITIQGNIDIEASRAQAAETAIATDLGTEIAARIAAVSSEETRAMLAEAALSATFSAAISTEVTRAIAAEGVLQSNIDVEKYRIDAILIGASASADNFAEIVSLINSVDTTNDQVFAGYVLSNDAALAAEAARATAAEASLSATFSTAISTEVSRATAAELVLTNDLSTEVSRATAAEGVLTSALSVEEASRIAGDSALQSSLNNEIADRIASGQSLQSALDAEVIRATAAEDMLDVSLNSEVLRATAVEGVLTTNLATETAARIAADTALATDFTNIYCKKVAVTGTPNGVLTTFTLALSVRIGSEMIYVNGLLMEEGEDYTTIITSGKVSGVEFFIAPVSEMKVRAYGVCGI